MGEIWVVVVEFPKYEASNGGQIRNKQRGNIIKGNKTPDGYIRVRLYNNDGASVCKMRSNIIAVTFCVKESEQHDSVDHLNRIRDDDRAINLRWATKSEQALNKDHSVSSNKYRPVCQYDRNGSFIKLWRGVRDVGNELQINATSISNACKNLNLYENFYWRYYVEILPNEVWKLAPYPEYDPMYASSYGRIMISNGKIIEGSADGKYLRMNVSLKDSTKRVMIRKHIIIAATFLGRNDVLTVNHEDGNTKNNCPSNLKYMTIQDNVIHSYATGLNQHVRKVNQFSLEGTFIAQYPSLSEAGRQNNNTPANIYGACIGRSQTSKGYQWRYAD